MVTMKVYLTSMAPKSNSEGRFDPEGESEENPEGEIDIEGDSDGNDDGFLDIDGKGKGIPKALLK